MNLNLLRTELRRSGGSFLAFALGILFTLTAFLAFFDVFAADAALMNELMQNFPPQAKAAFGIADVDLSDPEGYLSFVFTYVSLIAAVFSAKLGLSLLSEEPRAKTADFLLTKPISRTAIVMTKALVLIIWHVLQFIVIWLAGILLARILVSEPIDESLYRSASLGVLLTQLVFAGMGFFLGAVIPRIRSVVPLVLGLVFVLFIVDMLQESLRDSMLVWFSPFSWFETSWLLDHEFFRPVFVILAPLLFLTGLAAALVVYRRRDMAAV